LKCSTLSTPRRSPAAPPDKPPDGARESREGVQCPRGPARPGGGWPSGRPSTISNGRRTSRSKWPTARSRHEDFDDVLADVRTSPSQSTCSTILTSEAKAEIMYSLAKSPAELARISALPPLLAAREIGRLEAKVASGAAPQKPKPAAATGSTEQSWRQATPQLGVWKTCHSLNTSAPCAQADAKPEGPPWPTLSKHQLDGEGSPSPLRKQLHPHEVRRQVVREGLHSPTFSPGTTINIPKPARATATSGATASFPDHTEESMSVTVGQYNASFAPPPWS
jgi:hypothetical protein